MTRNLQGSISDQNIRCDSSCFPCYYKPRLLSKCWLNSITFASNLRATTLGDRALSLCGSLPGSCLSCTKSRNINKWRSHFFCYKTLLPLSWNPTENLMFYSRLITSKDFMIRICRRI